jgi:hypothetical protein
MVSVPDFGGRGIRTVLVVVSVALVGGCSRPRRPADVPASSGRARCSVKPGDSRSAVSTNCGKPCSTGGIEKQACPGGGLTAACWWECDIFGPKAVCYVDDVVMGVRDARDVAHRSPCTWKME